jgi:hypothetical protein
MNAHDEEPIKRLLQEALPPIKGEPESGLDDSGRDLWPAVLKRLDARPANPPRFNWVLFDWALLAGLVGVAALFPTAIPVLLYYL